MMILRTSTSSPFGRKIRMALIVLGLNDRVEIVSANTSDENDDLRTQNPLGKVPTLIQPDGEALYDSRVIVEYLNELDGRDILIPRGARIGVLRQQALADGMLDAAILQMYEARFRSPELHVPKWLDHQQGKIDRALAFAEASHATPGTGLPHIGEIALAAALGYFDFRFAGAWRLQYPNLLAWLADFSQRVPAFDQTAPAG